MSRFTLRTCSAIGSAIVIWAFVIASYLVPATVVQAQSVSSQPFNRFLHAHYYGQFNFGLAQEQYDNRAYPKRTISYDQSMAAYNAFQAALARVPRDKEPPWQLIGPTTANVPGLLTYTGRSTTVSGRVTAIAVSTPCNKDVCRVWVGTAGGGIWTTDDGLAPTPSWRSSSKGLASNAIGSITIDPYDLDGRTLYVGTGEANQSFGDIEAGVGLYKSTDFGRSWKLVPGSVAAAKKRSIGAVAIDPKNEKHIYIGTDVAQHGTSSVTGGGEIPPNAPVVGLYESTNGGATFHLVFSKVSNTSSISPGGGITKITFDHTGLSAGQPWRIYFSVSDFGVYRGSGSGPFEEVFASAGGGKFINSFNSRTEFALAPNSSKLRIYVGDSSGVGTADFYRVDDANVPASTLTNGVNNPGWLKLSNPTKGTPGFASYNFCISGSIDQCRYDMVVSSPPGRPDTVWIGGIMQYSELSFFGNPTPPSNGRTVQRSTDAGVSFTDMTDDTESPPLGMHPDQHAAAFASSNPDIAFLGSDGGVVRTSGAFADASSQCASRGVSGANLVDCQMWLKAIPTQIFSLNDGLSTLQFQSLTVNPQNPRNDMIGGTQDNGTWAFTGSPTWFQTATGDGGQSVIDVGNPNIRMHTYTSANVEVNFKGTDPRAWDFIGDPLIASHEAAAFYVPLIGDPQVSQTMFVGLEHVWRTQDSGGPQAYLDQHCNDLTGDFKAPCGDWEPLGPNLVGATFGTNKGGGYVAAISRAPSDTSTMWVATRFGRLFISKNAKAPAANVTFTRIDTSAQPNRFISGIAVDPKDPDHAFVSFSGYDAHTPTTPGHVFEVRYNRATGIATWTNISSDLGDMPITGIAYDGQQGDLYVATDFGVLRRESHTTDWDPAAPGLPPVAVYGLTIFSPARVLYAATHGRGAWRLDLQN